MKFDTSMSELTFNTKQDSSKARELLNNFRQNLADAEMMKHEAQIYSMVYLLLLMVLSVIIFIAFLYKITRPLSELQKATGKIRDGDFSVYLPETGIKEIRELEHSFNSMSRELNSTQKKLLQAEKDTMWKELSRILAHEIKNPLTPIQLSIQRLEEKYDHDHKKFYEIFPESVSIINQEINNLKLLVSSFSNFAKNINPEFSEFNPKSIVDEILDSYKLNFEIEVSGDNCTILFDRTHFYQIITNLVQNAIDASAKEDKIHIEITRKDRNTVISISDSGKGINETDIYKIFEPYFTKKKKGTGLGLALVKKLVDVNNSGINVTSKENEGSCFEIVIPNRFIKIQEK
ncbi:MAG: ATP-binding protein [Candidatus Tenebribacter burtonii]|jgi:two-component system nitrogen regulation sensor histidine kinase NtrY|nr:ATP-binding protein [Candidatus Tenebribacter burtonii]